jgi:signal transduction histidine kinase/ActR/RegA family two-component response regulator
MRFRDLPIRRKLMALLLSTSGAVLVLTGIAFVSYEFVSFRAAAVRNLNTVGRVIAANCTAPLAFDNQADATDVLTALKGEPQIVAAALYDARGNLFAQYRSGSRPLSPAEAPPATPGTDGYRFVSSGLVGVEPVREGANRRLGTLYLRADLRALKEQLTLYSLIAVVMTGVAFFVAYLLSRLTQQQISRPIQVLAETARAVSERRDYSVRATKLGSDELGSLTDAFNQMLAQIQDRDQERKQAADRLQAQLGRLNLLGQITRAIGDRQDVPSIFQVVVRSLEEQLPAQLCCVCLHDQPEDVLTVTTVTPEALAKGLAMPERARIPVDENGLSRCLHGQLVYEPDVRELPFAFPARLARGGLRSMVAAPLLAESKVFGVLVAARTAPHSFSSGECEFLRQLSEHVGLAAQQAQLYQALQRAYDDLKQTQQTVMQQERLLALGKMASGIAHDINNAISPIALYADSMLERETTLTPTVRGNLEIIRRAIDDVANTVARMREFYRREPEQALVSVDLNRLVAQVVDLTRARWHDMSQLRGIVVKVRTELTPALPTIAGIEGELRDALTNLIFNAVDAMPTGGELRLQTRLVRRDTAADGSGEVVQLDVVDSGVGMDEETRRRCLEPFFTTKGERGTGLGLAMVYGTMQRHGADLDVESAVGQGTTVRLSFGVPTVPVGPDTAIAPVQVVAPMRILLVDDDPLLLRALRATLEADGHGVTTADGGQAGIDAFAAAEAGGAPFEVVITDLGMPYVDGRTVAAAVKSVRSTVPVLLLTGWGRRLIAEAEVPPHVDRVLSKPPRLRELREALAGARSRPGG